MRVQSAEPGQVGARTLRADLPVLIVAVIWGSSYVVMQEVGETVPAGAFLALRFLTALPVMLLLAARTWPQLSVDEVRTGTFFGFLLYGILMFETSGVKHTSAANSGFLIATSVVLIPVFERLLSRRRQPALVYTATVAALVGCGMLALSDGLRPRSGDLIILAAALIRAFQITLFGRRRDGAQQSLLHVTAVELLVVLVLASASSVLVAEPVWTAAASTDLRTWLLIAYLGVLGTAYAFFVQLRMARTASSTRVGIILCTEPVFAAFFALTLAGERLGPLQLIGGALVVSAAFVGRAMEGRPPGSRAARSSKVVQAQVSGGGDAGGGVRTRPRRHRSGRRDRRQGSRAAGSAGPFRRRAGAAGENQ